jgi:dihydrodipicolinate synthase/N-acetylneuraminate lyase
MSMDGSAKAKRSELINRLFGEGIPRLWCPPLTHYTDDGSIDLKRMAAHLGHMSRWINTYLVPGTTGDAWEMTEDQIRQVLAFDLDIAQKLNIQILVGILKTDAEAARQSIVDTLAWLKERTGIGNNEEVIDKTPVCGFAVCPPRGPNLSQEQIYNALVPVLELGAPVALYQLPQVTKNEMSPEIVARLAAEFGNFYLFKDSSGRDKVALSGLDFGGVNLLRGGESDYHKWLRTVGGCYDGFLLGSGNCFARQLKSIIQDLSAGNLKAAQDLSTRVTGVVNDVSDGAADIPASNPFANANKAIDHFFAHGPEAIDVTPPRICSGQRLPVQIIKIAGQALTHNGLMPTNGYLPTQGQ